MIKTTDEAIVYLQSQNYQLLRQNQQLKELAATAYQIVGAADGPVELLDNLSTAANGHPLPHDPEAGLPWCPKNAWGGN